jgi:hypothetical protein
MFEVVPAAGEVTKLRDLARAARDERIAVRYPASYEGGRWQHSLFAAIQAAHPGARFVRVPTDPDRVERVILELASTFGDEVVRGVAESLRAEPDTLSATLRHLEEALGGSPLVVDRWSSLRVTDDAYDAGHALDGRLAGLRTWLADRARVITDGDFAPPSAFKRISLEIPGPETPPSVLRNGADQARPDLWERFSPDVGVYNAALAMLALQENPAGVVSPPAWKVRDHVANRLPDGAKELLFLLGVHRRPLGPDVCAVLNMEPAAETLLTQLGLCERLASGLVLDPAWCDWCLVELGPRVASHHARLATAFASLVRLERSAIDRQAVAVLEAHRHYLAAGDDEGARRFARYSAALLIEEGKQRSLLRRFGEAARLYQSVLELADGGVLPLGDRLRGYVQHYVHFNRARAELESLADTERGYRSALDHWPDNALFWSRLVRTELYGGKTSQALQTLETARARVPAHDDKDAVLIARTVRGLLDRQHLVDAILVWGSHAPATSYERDVASSLERALASGWLARELAVPAVEPLVFFHPQRVKVTRSGAVWIAELTDLDTVARAASAREALMALIARVREDVTQLVAELTHTLDADTVARKQLLLGAIDIVSSHLDASSPPHVWVLGDVCQDEHGAYWLRTKGTRDLWFEIPADVARQTQLVDLPYLAEVVAGPSGVPRGPVIRMEAGYGSSDALWERWRSRSQDGS